MCVLTIATCAVTELSAEVPAEPTAVIAWVGEAWTEAGWDQTLKRKYMRLPEDKGWHRRMLGMQALVRSGEAAVGPLAELLENANPNMRIFAAQTLGYLGPLVPRDTLGMSGATGLKALLGPMKTPEENRDVKKHIDYALLRDGVAVKEAVGETLLSWDSKTIDSAIVGEMAPDFQLTALTGETYKLSDFRDKKAVVLVFIYGDT